MTWPPDKPAPCGGWPDHPTINPGCGQQTDPAPVQRILNQTLVPNPLCSEECALDPCVEPMEELVAPAPRPAIPETPTLADCGGDGGTPRGPWPEELLATLAIENGDTLNKYVLSDPASYADYSSPNCRATGAKRIYALKNWHGCWGFDSFMRGDLAIFPGGPWPSEFSGDCSCLTAFGYTDEPDPIKYRTMSAVATYELHQDEEEEELVIHSGSATRTCTVDKDSGKKTFGGSDSEDVGGGLADAIALLGVQGWGKNVLFDKYCAISGDWDDTPGAVVTGSGDNRQIEADYEFGVGHFYTASISVDLTAGTYVAETTHIYEALTEYRYEELSLTATGLYYYEYQSPAPGGGGRTDTHIEKEITITLGTEENPDTYTSDDLNDDVNELLATWNHCEPLRNEWISDDICRGGPLVTRNERYRNEPTLADDADEVDESLPHRPSQPDGGIIGAPLDLGSDAPFDFYAVAWTYEDSPDGLVAVPEYYGQWSPYRNAPQWFSEDQSPWYLYPGKYLPPGPFVAYNFLTNPDLETDVGGPIPINNGTLIKCKWAEAHLFARPMHNWQRPCGADDVATRDPDTVDCDLNPTGDIRWPNTACSCAGTFVAITDATNATPIVVTTAAPHGRTTGDTVRICGVEGNPAANGTRKLVVTGSDEAELHDESDVPVAGDGAYTEGGSLGVRVPDNFWNWTGKQGKFVVKKWLYDFRRFAESWRLINAASVRTVYNNTTDPDCPTITPPDPFHFNIVYGTSGDYDGLPIAIGTGSWWLYNQQTTDDCIEFSACAVNLLLVQPDEPIDCPANTKQISLPNLACDDQYGTFWIARVEQWMADPLWKAPGHGQLDILCDEGCDGGFEEDDGSCKENYPNDFDELVCVYPMRLWEEAVAAIPAGAPALPAGSRQIGCPDYITNRDAETPVGNPSECEPPFYISAEINGKTTFTLPGGCFAPWAIQLRQETCVNANGRFAAIYHANGVHTAEEDEEIFHP